MTSACTHQFTAPARLPSARRKSSRKVIISVAMNTPMSTDSPDSLPERLGPEHHAPNEQHDGCPTSTAGRERHERVASRTGTRRCA